MIEKWQQSKHIEIDRWKCRPQRPERNTMRIKARKEKKNIAAKEESPFISNNVDN
jgi:hypothetical protein